MCGMSLVAFEKLPPSHDAMSEDGVPVDPASEPLKWTYVARGRGLLAVCGLLGIALFFFPWIHVTLPDDVRLTGFFLARRLGWAWGAGVGWLVLIPTVLSRRSIVKMRGARVAAAFLAAAPLITCVILWLRPPHGGLVPLRFTYEPAFWLSLGLSAVALVLSLRFGGRVDDIEVSRGTSHGQVLH